MKKVYLIILFFGSIALAANNAEEAVSNMLKFKPVELPPAGNKVYFGGSIGFNFWNDYYYVSASPWVGYKVTPKFSLGAKVNYSYLSDDRYESYPALNSHNFGGSIFARFRVIPQLYAHSEFLYSSYESIKSFNVNEGTYETERIWIPFLLVGAGYSQSVGKNLHAYVEILFDVLQDSKSPYKKWDPFVSAGVGVGF